MHYLPMIKTGMSLATRDSQVKRLGDPDWDFSGPRSLTGPPVTCSIQRAADRMKDTKGVTAILPCLFSSANYEMLDDELTRVQCLRHGCSRYLPAALRTAALSPLTFTRHLKSHLFD